MTVSASILSSIMASYPTTFQKNTAGQRPALVDQWGNLEEVNLSSGTTGTASSVLNNFRIEDNSSNSASATGNDATAIGKNSLASGDNSLAVGSEPTAAQGPLASGANSIAMGAFKTQRCTASGVDAMAMGVGAVASANDTACYGGASEASGLGASAFGNSAVASGINGTVIGYTSTASGDYSSALGPNTTASATRSIAIGDGATNNVADSCLIAANTDLLARFEVPATVTQLVSNTTAVDANSAQLRITMFAAVAASTAARFRLTNTRIQATSVVVATAQAKTSNDIPLVVGINGVGAGSVDMVVYNPDAAQPTSAAPVLHVTVLYPAV